MRWCFVLVLAAAVSGGLGACDGRGGQADECGDPPATCSDAVCNRDCNEPVGAERACCSCKDGWWSILSIDCNEPPPPRDASVDASRCEGVFSTEECAECGEPPETCFHARCSYDCSEEVGMAERACCTCYEGGWSVYVIDCFPPPPDASVDVPGALDGSVDAGDAAGTLDAGDAASNARDAPGDGASTVD